MNGPRETTPAVSEPLLSIVVPVYNDARHLREVIEYMMQSPCPIQREWIFVDDGSSDDSRQILREMQERYDLRLIEQPRSRGRGSAIIKGISEAQGDLIMIQDAGIEYDPFDVPELLEPLLLGRADVVFGDRFDRSMRQVHRTWRYFWNRLLTLLSNGCSGIRLSDMGACYKIFRADLLKAMKLKSQRFGIDIELTAYVAKTAAQVYELPVHFHSSAGKHRKSAGWSDGIAALFHLVRFNFLISREDALLSLPELYRTPHRRRTAPPITPDIAIK